MERAPGDPDLCACETLGLWWTVVEDPMIGPMRRLSRDRGGLDLLPTPDEAEARARDANKGLQAEVEALRAELAKAKGKRRKR